MSQSFFMKTEMRQRRGSTFGALLAGALLVWPTMTPPACADDVTTLSGITYREVRMVRVDPDGVTWEHSTGICKVDFTDLPEAIRKSYHYDAEQAAAFQAARNEAAQKVVQQAREDQRKIAAWRAKHFQQQAEVARAGAEPGQFIYRRGVADVAAEQSIDEQIESKKSAEELLTKDDGTFWDRRTWAVPCLLIGGGYDSGVAFDPHVDLSAEEFKADLHSQGEAFFKPDYMTKAYYKDLERAEAFASGRP
jgi:hypothetical protein